ncbi:ctcl tumor antigen hd-cl-01 [Anaeramoeba flamelloides]|uniref:Ctcl tumor antigen hd-cl-01 n=1 Tax=Anaeramoeba flamelloides TaxID=1746091 RepID=A0ABQ8Z5M5_9EUKA|nr:ctcl tumor antigen hd-cl-01 [Anaeramoeba flamelloides]
MSILINSASNSNNTPIKEYQKTPTSTKLKRESKNFSFQVLQKDYKPTNNCGTEFKKLETDLDQKNKQEQYSVQQEKEIERLKTKNRELKNLFKEFESKRDECIENEVKQRNKEMLITLEEIENGFKECALCNEQLEEELKIKKMLLSHESEALTRAQKQIEELTKTKKDKEKKLTNLRKEKKIQEKILKQKINSLFGETVKLKKENQKLIQDNRELKRNISVMEETKQESLSEKEFLEQEVHKYQKISEAKEQETKKQRSKIKKFKNKEMEKDCKIEQLFVKMRCLKNEKDQFQEESEISKQRNTMLTSEKEHIKEELTAMGIENKKLKDEEKRLNSQLNEKDITIKNLNQQNVHLKNTKQLVERLRKKLNLTQEQNKKLNFRIDDGIIERKISERKHLEIIKDLRAQLRKKGKSKYLSNDRRQNQQETIRFLNEKLQDLKNENLKIKEKAKMNTKYPTLHHNNKINNKKNPYLHELERIKQILEDTLLKNIQYQKNVGILGNEVNKLMKENQLLKKRKGFQPKDN